MNNIDNWLFEYIKDQQARYPAIYPTPLSVMDHLLFCIGNGVEFLEEVGNFCVQFEDSNRGRWISFDNFYSSIISLEYLKETHTKDLYRKLENRGWSEDDISIRLLALRNPDMSQDGIFDMAYEQEEERINTRYNSVQFIKCSDYSTPEYWYKQILGEYVPHIEVSRYSKIHQFNEKTPQGLVQVSLDIVDAYIQFCEQCKDPNFLLSKPLKSRFRGFPTPQENETEIKEATHELSIGVLMRLKPVKQKLQSLLDYWNGKNE